ncbi:hypothetical protein [Paracoccus aminovorans]|uniref:hypothetical protein n=1 Tax=Paracoccus aminovorans TaxID=34004 RepID=UPI000A760CA6|nr:hypothetical protein [Paracoccus aminovorans]
MMRRGMENALRANPLDVRQEYEKQLRGLQEAYGEAMLELLARKKLADGIRVSLVNLCAWFGVPRRTVDYKPTKAAPKINPGFAEPIKAMIEENPSFGYRTVAFLLGFNKNTVQRIFQLKHWQVHKRPIGMRPRSRALPSVATALNERWSTDLCRIWAGKDGWTSWPWSSTVTRMNFSAGTCRAPAR